MYFLVSAHLSASLRCENPRTQLEFSGDALASTNPALERFEHGFYEARIELDRTDNAPANGK
jgi:hypothetical protein